MSDSETVFLNRDEMLSVLLTTVCYYDDNELSKDLKSCADTIDMLSYNPPKERRDGCDYFLNNKKLLEELEEYLLCMEKETNIP